MNDNSIAEYADIYPLSNDRLYLDQKECQEIARQFEIVVSTDHPGHIYFDTHALGDEIEIIAAYGEYDDLF